MRRLLTTKRFIERARSVHGDRYDYSLVEYKGTNIKVPILCPIHGVFEQKPANHLVRKQGCSHLSCIGEKRRKTHLNKYGVEYPAQSKEIQEKIRQTNLTRYGTKSPLESKEIQEKIRQTNLQRYGAEHPAQSKDIQEKTKQTNLARYGVEYTIQTKDVQEKIKQTNFNRYGTEYSSQKHYSQTTLDKLNSFEWLCREYTENNKTSYQIAEELNVDPTTVCNYLRYHNIHFCKVFSFSKMAIQWLESIMEKEGIFIQHAGNIGEFSIPDTKYSADGYCRETNTIYEFYGDAFHGNLNVYAPGNKCHPFRDLTALELNNITTEREDLIKSLGYIVIVIWEGEYLKKDYLITVRRDSK